MVDVRHKICLHSSCTAQPRFNVVGSKRAAFCKQHAENGMVKVGRKTCVHRFCTRPPTWGMLFDEDATACSRHTVVDPGGLVINFAAVCKVGGCSRTAKWGPYGKQPTHCPDHGPLTDGLVCTIGIGRVKRSTCPSPSQRPENGTSIDIKSECAF